MQKSKKCKTCRRVKALTNFARNKNCGDGHLTECKACNKHYRQAHAKHRAEVEKQRRRRLGVKPKKIFTTQEERQQAHLEACKRWQRRNAASIKEYGEVYRRANKPHLLALIKTWRENNRARIAAWSAKRRTQVLRGTPKWANMDKIVELYEQAQELTLLTGIPHEVDHYYPLNGKTVCGLHVEENLQVITKKENLKKAAHRPEEFY